MPIFRGVGGSGDASTDAYASQVALDAQTATTKANEASASASAASSSASAAASSEAGVSADATAADNARIAAEAAQTAAELAENNAETAENNAETAETNAESSASAASTSATNASNSASAAATSATNSSDSASAASTSATNASNSASAASTSATNASNSASAASTSASNASTSETNASNSASAASTSATNASNSATASANSATAAADSASEAADTAAAIGTLDSLSDVTITTVSTGEVLKYDGTEWVNGTASTVASLDDLTDVSVAGVADGQALVYNSTSGDWEASTPASTTVSTTAPVSPSAGDLWWNSESGQLKVYYTDVDGSQWVDAAASAANPSLVINDLTDVTITSLASGDLLQYDGTDWVNSNAIDGTVIGGTTAAAGTFTTLTASSIDYPAADGTAGQVLVTDGSGTLSFADAGAGDKIEEGNSSVEVVDTGTGHVAVTVDGAETARFVDNGDFKFNSGYGSVATAYGCRAWVNFNGTGVVAIREDGNVSSITDNGTGDYTVNFSTSIVDDDYAVTTTGVQRFNASTSGVFGIYGTNYSSGSSSVTTSSVRLVQRTSAGLSTDIDVACVAIFR